MTNSQYVGILMEIGAVGIALVLAIFHACQDICWAIRREKPKFKDW